MQQDGKEKKMAAFVNEEVLLKILNDKNFSNEVIAFLNSVIDEELAKDADEIDCDLIDECTNMILEIKQSEDDGLAVIVPLISSKKLIAKVNKTGLRRLSRGMQAAVVACIILLSGLTANAAVYKISGINVAGEIATVVSEKLEEWGVILPKKESSDEELTRATQRTATTAEYSAVYNEVSSDSSDDETMNTYSFYGNVRERTTKPVTDKAVEETAGQVTQVTVQETTSEIKEPETKTEIPTMPAVTYTLFLDANGGECDVESVQVQSNRPIGELPVPERYGYEFRGWYNSKISHHPILSFIATEIKPTTLYNLYENATVTAKWVEVCTIHLDMNGGECEINEVKCALDKTPDLPTPTKEGWVFDGWYHNGVPWNESEITDYDNIVFTANWIPDIRTWEMTFNPNGGTCAEESKIITLYEPMGKLPVPKRDGYLFLGWYLGDNINSEQITASTIHNERSNVSVNAIWTKAMYTAYFDAAGGECAVESKNFYDGQPIGELPVPTRAGYNFSAWYFNGDAIDSDTVIKYNKTVKLEAKWVAASFSVEYNANEGVFSSGKNTMTKSYTYLKKYGTLPVAYRAGYNFDGWYTKPEGGNQILSSNSVLITENTTYYAHWSELEGDVYTIIFHSNSVSDKIEMKPYNNGDELGNVKPASSSNFCTFLGWYTDPYFGTRMSNDSVITSNMNLYAHWSPMLMSCAIELEKTVYEVGEEIDPATVKFRFKVWNTTYTYTVEELMADGGNVYCRFVYDTSEPGEQTVTLMVAIADLDTYGNVHLDARTTITVVEPSDNSEQETASENKN